MFIEFSNGVKLSEETVMDALKRQGISVESPKPVHIFEAGDVAVNQCFSDGWRFIVKINGNLYSVDKSGTHRSTGQTGFETNHYKFVNKLRNLMC